MNIYYNKYLKYKKKYLELQKKLGGAAAVIEISDEGNINGLTSRSVDIK